MNISIVNLEFADVAKNSKQSDFVDDGVHISCLQTRI